MQKLPLLVVCLGVACGCSRAPVAVSKAEPLARPIKLSPDQLISNGKTQVANDPGGAMGWSQLSLAYLTKSRKLDSYDDAKLAEESARKSLELRRNGNVMAAVRLTQSLLNQHRFQDALTSSKDALAIAGNSPPAQFSRIECLIETGKYEEANQFYTKVGANLPKRDQFLARSRMHEIYGNPQEAIRLVTELLADEKDPPESRTFLHTRLGDLHVSIEKFEDAEKHYAKALDYTPQSWKAMLGMCRVAYAKKDWQKVVTLGHETEELVSMTDVVAIMGDAFKAMGNTKMAAEHYGEAATLAGYETKAATHSHGSEKAHSHGPSKKHGHPLDRQYARFAADHDRDLDNALKAANEDLKQRQDLLAWDTLAWVRYKRGELALAREAMRKAVRTGTKDASILAHARLILGETQ